MAKPKTVFICQECGWTSVKWLGRCAECGALNSLVEEVLTPAAVRTKAAGAPAGTVVSLNAAESVTERRVPTGIAELDRVLGGGLVTGSVVLVGGEPGIGKSTLLLQASARLSAAAPCLYVSGEESTSQIRLRAERLGVTDSALQLMAETEVNVICGTIEQIQPGCVVIDSVQALHDADLNSPVGTVSQVRAGAARFVQVAKELSIPIFLVGHVTKDGALAGPKTLEHLVDTVLYFEGDSYHALRVLRATKNRFGSTNETGIFAMGDAGLDEVPNPSGAFLNQRPRHVPGSVVTASLEGSRCLLVEVQALVSASQFPAPRRVTTGIDYGRCCMILAVLEKRAGLNLSAADVFVNVAGGLRMQEPAVDLAVCVAVASSFRDRPTRADCVVFGEIGLAGEVRSVRQTETRLREAARLGFQRCILAHGGGVASAATEGKVPLLTITGVESVVDALESALEPAGPQ